MTDNYFDDIKVFAYLSSAWEDITADVLQDRGINASWGIRGDKPTDILAGTGSLSFTLKNNDYKYFPNGASPLTGWGKGTPVKVVFYYLGLEHVRPICYVDGLDYKIGQVANEYVCNVTCLDWMDYAAKYPMIAPDIEISKRADQAITTILAAMPKQPAATNLDTGAYTFPAVFDSTTNQTTAYAEFAKLINSEFGNLYLTGDGTLTFEAGDSRDGSVPLVTIPSPGSYLLSAAGDYVLSSTGEKIAINAYEDAAIDAGAGGGIDNISISYGKGVINHATVTAFPKRVDIEPTIVYKLDTPIPIASGQTINLRATYKEQSSGARANAVPSSMITPESPGATDPYLMTAVSFNDAAASTTATDSTGRHTWTFQDPPQIVDDPVHFDAFGTMRISSSIIGNYAIFGGYANYYMTSPSSADFNFGSGAFTIGWYENRINVVNNQATMARDATSTYPPYLLGYLDAATQEMQVYMSSNGSSWDIGFARSLGRVKLSRWTYYEVSRDEDGFFYLFADGKLTDTWYSALAFPTNSNAFSVGRTQNTQYAYFGFDEFFIKKGQCLHKTDFDPPVLEISPTLLGDYQMNTAADGSGTDISGWLNISATYDSIGVDYILTNNNASAGYITYLTARGIGVYAYNPIDALVTDSASVSANGYQSAQIRQQYQQTTAAGLADITAIVANEKDPQTKAQSVSIIANYSARNMTLFMFLDVGDLITVTHTPSGISAEYYYIQSVSYNVGPGGIVRATYGLIKDYEH